ncbi:uncharacterized protein LOC131947824 [Physella acuta]|uniref:uncharacterized protein LOC131947824 n=1 Tax=Physella acuta TaxID=109671 RepID=UPI0027DE44CE|nr:uncharacterized protein LOC131947824 [Physella acuta]
MKELLTLLLLSAAVRAESGCQYTGWTLSFDKEGESRCSGYNHVIRGFYRSNPSGGHDEITLLEKAMCCSPSGFWSLFDTQIFYADWYPVLDGQYTWATCPNGFFLNGMFRSAGNPAGLHDIEYARCSKPSNHPYYTGECYDQDIKICFDHQNLCQCKDEYYVTGIYKSDCDQLHCLEKLKCCRMADGRDVLDGEAKVKTLVMDLSMADIANLANMLGYGWCDSCRATCWIGVRYSEDCRRQGDKWVADTAGPCDGYKSDQRLAMDYKDWSFGMMDIKYGEPIIEELIPQSIDTGTFINNDASEATKTITRAETIVRTVTHTTTSSWKDSSELDMTFGYNPPPIGGMTSSVAYKFNYETSSTTLDETKNQQSQTFTVSTSKTLKPYSAVKWDLILSKTRSTATYTATIITKFSTELQGFLRWGGGASEPDTNYHYKYRGSEDRPTFNYRFGNSSMPFYTALKRECNTNSLPWLWNDMATAYPGARDLIGYLSDEKRYVFILTGKFEDVVGTQVQVRWDEIPLPPTGTEQEVAKTGTFVARAGPKDKPATSVPAPKVDIRKSQVKLGRYRSNSTMV